MKSKLLLLSFIALLAVSCRKETTDMATAPAAPDPQTLTLSEVRNWYQRQVNLQPSADLKTFSLAKLQPDWQKASPISGRPGNYWLVRLPGQPTLQGVKQGYRKIAFLKDSTGAIRARILEIVPDALDWQRRGKVSTEDLPAMYLSMTSNTITWAARSIKTAGRSAKVSSRPARAPH